MKKDTTNDLFIDSNNLSGAITDLRPNVVWNVIVDQFKNEYDKKINTAIANAKQEQIKYDKVFKKFIILGYYVLSILIIGCFVRYGINQFHNNDIQNQQRYIACQQGNTAGCLEGVHHEGGSYSVSPKVRLYRSEYKIATGKDLPLLDGEQINTIDTVHGWEVVKDENGEGVIIKKNTTIVHIQ